MIIIVKQVAGDSYALRSIPKIGGGFVAEEVQTGRVLAMQGGFDVVGSSYNRATQALRQPGSAFKPIVYDDRARERHDPGLDHRRCALLRLAGRRARQQMLPSTSTALCRAEDDALGRRAVAQPDDRPRRRRRRACRRSSPPPRSSASATIPNYLSIALGAGETTVLRLVNAYAILANQGRAVKPTLIDYVQDRNGKIIYPHRQSLRGHGQLQRCRTGTARRCRARRRATRQLLDPLAAFQMVHIMEGVIERGTATVLRDLDRPMFGKTGTTSGPTNVWFVGGTPDVVGGVYLGYDQPRPHGRLCAQGGRIAAPIFKHWAQTALKDMPKVPFVAPPGIRWVAHRPGDRQARLRHLPDRRRIRSRR